MFSELFYTTLYTAVIALILGMCNYFYKSKCTEVKICCITIKRDVKIEEEIDMAEHEAHSQV